MRLRKFKAANMRDALASVRRELGPEALVVATKPVRSGVLGTQIEVTAAVDDAEDDGEPDFAPSESGLMPPPADPLSDEAIEKMTAPLRTELRSLRSFVRTLARQRPSDPRISNELQALQRTVATLAARQHGVDEPELDLVAAQHELARPTEARIVAMVGPTGVGKTTTIAKLAARAALVEGKRVHILSLDTYRVGATAQIRSFGKLMDVPVTVVSKPREELAAALARTRDADVVYVDTAGRSSRDPRTARLLQRSLAGLAGAEIHLAIAAGTSRLDIDAIAQRYAPLGISRLVFTKVDETGEHAELVRSPARLQIPVSFITTGQKVPEDLEDADDARLLELATQGFPFAEAA